MSAPSSHSFDTIISTEGQNDINNMDGISELEFKGNLNSNNAIDSNQRMDLYEELKKLNRETQQEHYKINALKLELKERQTTKTLKCVEYLRGLYANQNLTKMELEAWHKYRNTEKINDITFQQALRILDFKCIEYLIHGYIRRIDTCLTYHIPNDIKALLTQYFSTNIYIWITYELRESRGSITYEGDRHSFLYDLEALKDVSVWNDTQKCIVCQTNKKQFCIFPCMHVVICEKCATDYFVVSGPGCVGNDTCPVCHTRITDLQKIFDD